MRDLPGPGEQPFVGRQDLLTEIYGFRGDTGRFVITGPPGVGKTTFASRLAARVIASEDQLVRIGLQTFRVDSLGPSGGPDTSSTIQRSFDQFCDLVLAICRQLRTGPGRRFREQVKAAKRNPQAVAQPSRIRATLVITRSENVSVDSSLNTDQGGVHTAIDELVRRFNETVVDYVGRTAAWAGERSHRLFVLFDEFDTILDDELAQWVVELSSRLQGAGVVLIGRPHIPTLRAFTHRTLSNFTASECWEYLCARCGRQTTDEIGGLIYSFTGGNPQAVEVIADLVDRAGPDSTARLLESWRAADPGVRYSDRLTDLVAALLAAGADPVPAQVSTALAVVRQFDQGLLAALLADHPDIDADDVYARAARLPFVEISPGTDGKLSTHRVHEFVRSALVRDFKTFQPAQFARLHAHALVHYRNEIEVVKRRLGRADPFLEAVRYKDPRWRRLYNEWLYHLGHVVDPDDRAVARLLFADVYLDAVWWWGYYAPLTLCEDLLREWGLVCQDELDRTLLTQLTTFIRAFPPGWGTRHTEDPAWHDVTGAMLGIRSMGHLDSLDPSAADPSLRHLRAVTGLFLAEAAQSCGDSAAAGHWYADARAMFDTDMGRDWTAYQHAELRYDDGDRDGSLDLLHGVEERARTRRDHELLGRLALFTAADALAHAALPAAAGHCARAALHAFVFHVRQTAAPDEYSTLFHNEISQRVREIMTDLAARADPGTWADIVDRLAWHFAPFHRFTRWAPAVAGEVATVDAVLDGFPPLPTTADLHDPATSYVRAARWVEAQMRGGFSEVVVAPAS